MNDELLSELHKRQERMALAMNSGRPTSPAPPTTAINQSRPSSPARLVLPQEQTVAPLNALQIPSPKLKQSTSATSIVPPRLMVPSSENAATRSLIRPSPQVPVGAKQVGFT